MDIFNWRVFGLEDGFRKWHEVYRTCSIRGFNSGKNYFCFPGVSKRGLRQWIIFIVLREVYLQCFRVMLVISGVKVGTF